MLHNKTIAVVVPAYNEETQIGLVIESMPAFVDRIVVVNDLSKDDTAQKVEKFIAADTTDYTNEHIKKVKIEPTRYNAADIIAQEMSEKEAQYFTPAEVTNKNPDSSRIVLINHLKNGGVGAAIATGYKWCKDHNIDCTAVMAGDGQMDPSELEGICEPVVKEGLDYVKGNRLIHRSARLVIPRKRFFGNSVLSIMTKVASGYWRVSDTQTGYTAISLDALKSIDLFKIYRSYGMPNDMLVKLNIANCSMKEVPIKPVYQIGEKSKMRIGKVVPRVFWLLVRSFFKRLWQKYFVRDFHPLFLLYVLAIFLFLGAIRYGIEIIQYAIDPVAIASSTTWLIFLFLATFGFQSLLFAMWMDIQDNERLYK